MVLFKFAFFLYFFSFLPLYVLLIYPNKFFKKT